jgi:hypothetical protein
MNKIITPDEFENQLKSIEEEARSKVVELVLETRNCYFTQNFAIDDSTPLPNGFIDNPQIERIADSFVELGGWIYDRLNGITRLDKKSRTRKLRKVLGYNG